MTICGIELKANEALISIISKNDEQTQFIESDVKKISVKNDENTQDLVEFSNSIKNLINKYSIEKIAVKKRAKKGNFAGGAVTFKLEAIIQLNNICEVELIASQTISSYEKKNPVEYPDKLNKYQKQAFLASLAC